MKNGKIISELKTRFTHIVNHLLGLGKMFEDEELNIKILNCLTRTWEPKITTIKKTQPLHMDQTKRRKVLYLNIDKCIKVL